MKIEKKGRIGCSLLPLLFNLYSEYLTEDVLEGFGDLDIRGQVIRNEKYASNLMLLSKEETVLQGMIESLIEIGRFYGMERSVGKAKVMRISRQTSSVQMMIDQKQPKNVEYFNYLGSVIANDARCTREIKSGLPLQKRHSATSRRRRRRRSFSPTNWS